MSQTIPHPRHQRPRWQPSRVMRDQELRRTMADWQRAFAILGSVSQLQREPHLQLVPPLAGRSAS